jgi:hypothetical protein
MEQYILVNGKVFFDKQKNCFFLTSNAIKEEIKFYDNAKGENKFVQLWPSSMQKFVSELPRCIMDAREHVEDLKKNMLECADCLQKDLSTDHLQDKLQDKLLSTTTLSQWKGGKFATRIETCRYNQEVCLYLKFMYQHEDDKEGSLRTNKGPIKISINDEKIKPLAKFVERCIILSKVDKL